MRRVTWCRYFANLIEQRLGPHDNVIIITHEPTWLLEWFWASSSSSNLRQLVRGHLRGRARVHMAGEAAYFRVEEWKGGGGLSGDTFEALERANMMCREGWYGLQTRAGLCGTSLACFRQ